ncbi:hypothetical protein IC229_18830 [Spirosoma sp. BT702]|uniref:DoxX family membrane protein n=1 Tax=Spirosoma profusum TaxID=2771354 RepID=A0A926XXH7_9BACT|nr:hypothetical protein [Spirosoma profusum]MBD2702709.1 hypothetical protein [Spirosoma profusum]
MNRLFIIGRLLFASAMIAFGVIHLVTGNFPTSLLPIAADFPVRFTLVLLMGLILIVSGLCIGLSWKADKAALSLGALFLLCAFYPHLVKLVSNWFAGGTWTVFGELLALSAASFYIAGQLESPVDTVFENRFNVAKWSKWLFTVSLVIFGILHFQYGAFVATLIPAWIPARLFWAYFVGIAFIATAVSLISNKKTVLSSGLLGVMFLLWVVLLHVPRALTKMQSEPEWTSLSTALAMSGIAFFMAGAERQKTGLGRSATLPGRVIVDQ